MIAEHLKSSENSRGYKPKSIHCQCCSGFPAKRECGWQGRGEASTFQRLSSEQSSNGAQEPHVMPTPRTTLLFISTAREEIVVNPKKFVLNCPDIDEVYNF